MTTKRLNQWKEKLEKLSDQRERNVNRYIIPIEIKIEELRDKIENFEKSNVQMNEPMIMTEFKQRA